jgi:hypothetical protein
VAQATGTLTFVCASVAERTLLEAELRRNPAYSNVKLKAGLTITATLNTTLIPFSG